jgi:hypothetical protein
MSERTADALAPSERAEALRILQALARHLLSTNSEVEFYFVGGAVMYQAFVADPGTARVKAMFRPAEVVRHAAREVAEAEGLPDGWLHRTVRAVLSDGAGQGDYVALPGLRAFVARPEYVLAMKCGAMLLGEEFRETEDVRYVLRSMNVSTPEEALSLVSRYFTERQLAPDTRERLEALGGI